MSEEERAYGDPYASLFLEKRLNRLLGHFEREFERSVTEPTYEMYKLEFSPRFGMWGSFLPVEPRNKCHQNAWPAKSHLAKKPPVVPKPSISVTDSVGNKRVLDPTPGDLVRASSEKKIKIETKPITNPNSKWSNQLGEILDPDSSPKRIKLKEEGNERLNHADVARRDCLAGPNRQGLDVQVLSEARELKHRADRLKKKGMEMESVTLYFEAGLKFLQVACIWEVREPNQSMQMYSDTAALFEYCAKQYENARDMAGGALSYKCAEIASFKTAFLKNPGMQKDFQNIQSALQMLPHAESPPMPASNVEDLNNIATTNNVSCNLNPIALIHLLDYVNDINRAFDATRRCQVAFLGATESERAATEMCIKFSFENIDKFIGLTRKTAGSMGR